MRSRLTSLMLATAWALAGPAAAAELAVSFSYGHRGSMHQCISDAFEKAHPDISVTHRAPGQNYQDGHETLVRQSIVDQLPDVHFPGLSRFNEVVDRGIAVDLTPFLEGEPGLEDQGYIPALVKLTTVDGALYGLPHLVGTPIAIYNADLVRRAGGDPENLPGSWAEFVDLTARINALDPQIIGGLMHALDDWIFQALVYSAGGRILTEDRTDVAFDGPEGQRAMEALDRFAKESGTLYMPSDAALQQFATGKVGVILHAAGRVKGIAEQAGDRFALATSRFPAVDPEASLGMPIGGAAAVVATQDPEKQRAAWEYVKLATGPVGQACVVAGEGYPPVNTRAFEIDSVRRFFEENPLRRPDVEQMETAQPWVAFPGENGVKIVRVIADNVQRILQQEAGPDEALAAMAEQVRKLLPTS